MSKTLDRLKEMERIDIKPKQKTIKVEDLKHHPDSIRKVFNPEKLRELAESIKRFGIIEPLQIDPDNFIIQGNMRKKVIEPNKELKLLEVDEDIDVIKYKNTVDVRIRQLLSDIHKTKLSIYELAEAFKKIIDNKLYGIDTAYKLGKYLCVTPQYVYRILTILDASKETMKLVADGKVSQRMVAEVMYCLARNKRYMEGQIMEHIVKHKLNMAQAQRLVSEINSRERAYSHMVTEIRICKGLIKGVGNKFRFCELTKQQKKDLTEEVNGIDEIKRKLLSDLVRK